MGAAVYWNNYAQVKRMIVIIAFFHGSSVSRAIVYQYVLLTNAGKRFHRLSSTSHSKHETKPSK